MSEIRVRELAHKAVERADTVKLRAILELLDEDIFAPEEIAEIRDLSRSEAWTDWREIRRDV